MNEQIPIAVYYMKVNIVILIKVNVWVNNQYIY